MSRPVDSSAEERLATLLERTSRTFALSIPRLPEPTRRRVTVAYLLFRIADTLEDATHWDGPRRAEELDRLAGALAGAAPPGGEPAALAAAWRADPPLARADYLELLDDTPLVFEALDAIEPAAAASIRTHLGRTIERMSGFLRGARPAVADLDGLRAYCYAVAGIVGEMLTELFLLQSPSLEPDGRYLRSRAARFGEALQLVNILRDSADDAGEGRSFLPPSLGRAPVVELARGDLDAAREYVLRLQAGGAPRGVVEFTALPVLLAVRTLELVEREGPGAKVPRREVAAIVARLAADLAIGRPAVPAPCAS